MVRVCYELADKWESRTITSGNNSSTFEPSENDIVSWSANQSVVFLERVQNFKTPLSPGDIELMGSKYGYASSKNVELVSRYFVVGLKAKAQAVYEPTAELLGLVGRMKFVRPLFRGLNECDRELAVKTFEKNKEFYHPICRAMVEKDLFGEK